VRYIVSIIIRDSHIQSHSRTNLQKSFSRTCISESGLTTYIELLRGRILIDTPTRFGDARTVCVFCRRLFLERNERRDGTRGLAQLSSQVPHQQHVRVARHCAAASLAPAHHVRNLLVGRQQQV